MKSELYKKDKIIFKLTRKAKKGKELEKTIIKASNDLKIKEDLLIKFKAKAEQFDKQYKEIKQESDQRIDELETDMEKILQERKENNEDYRLKVEDLGQQVKTITNDCQHYEDLYQAWEKNWNTICKDKVKLVSGRY